jgi:hypothetical protein
MSDITKSADARLADAMNQTPQSRLIGFEGAAGDAVYIDSNNVLQAASTAAVHTGATGTVAFAGLLPRAYPSGTKAEVYGQGAEFFYADSGLVNNSLLWGSATAKKIGDARVGSAADTPVAMVVSATNIVLLRGV